MISPAVSISEDGEKFLGYARQVLEQVDLIEGYFALMARMNWAEVEPSGRRAPVPCTARMSSPFSITTKTPSRKQD